MDRRIGVAGLTVSLTLGLVAPALAQDGSAAPSAATGPWTTLVSGLDAPRSLAFGPDGTLYVGEQGAGGDQCMDLGEEGGQGCIGSTGSISSIVDGNATRVVFGIPSMTSQEGASGMSDIAVTADGTFVGVMGLGGGPEARAAIPAPFNEHLGSLVSVAADGTLTTIADLVQWEADNNPDAADPGSGVDSNPYAVAIAPDGSYLVADAGGNDLLMVAADGTITAGAVLHAQFVPAPIDPTASPAPDPNATPGLMPMQAVPTSVVIGPDGAAYVGQLTGFPFPAGGASVWRVAPGGEPEVYASGLTNIIDLAFGPDGTLWVLEFARNGLMSGDPNGALLTVPAGGGEATLVTDEGLMAPGAVAVGSDGTVYVTTGSLAPGGGSILTLDQ